VRIAGGNTLLSYTDDIVTMSDDEDTGTEGLLRSGSALDTSILVYGPDHEDVILFHDLFQGLSDLSEDSASDPGGNDGGSGECAQNLDREHPLDGYVQCSIEGRWVGTFAYDIMPPFECIVRPIVDGKIVGKGRDYLNHYEISGQFREQTADVSFTLHCSRYLPVKFKGNYDHSRDTIRGWWMLTEHLDSITEDEDPPQTPNHAFSMTRHSVNSFRFRNLLEPRKGVPEVSMARRRWMFATQTVLFAVQDKLGSWDFMRRRFVERNDWIELSIRRLPPGHIEITRGLMNEQQAACWEETTSTIHPSTLAIYDSIRRFLNDRWLYNV
jgi:hypothetical protein